MNLLEILKKDGWYRLQGIDHLLYRVYKEQLYRNIITENDLKEELPINRYPSHEVHGEFIPVNISEYFKVKDVQITRFYIYNERTKLPLDCKYSVLTPRDRDRDIDKVWYDLTLLSEVIVYFSGKGIQTMTYPNIEEGTLALYIDTYKFRQR